MFYIIFTNPESILLQVENSTENKDQELCMQIKNSLKRLRQEETGEKETDNRDNEEPILNLEVFPEVQVPVETQDDPKTTEEPSTEFHDESQTLEEEPSKAKVKATPSKIITPRTKPKRNPRRQVVIEQEIQKSIIAARNAPALEKVFVNSVKKTEESKPKQGTAKRARVETSGMPSDFDHTERLYEYGKYVAEQMMCFDEKDVRSAQAEINEVLSKFRLKYKILNCLSKPSNGNSPEDATHTRANVTETCPLTQNKSAARSGTKRTPQVYSGPRSKPDSVAQVNLPRSSTTQCGSQSQATPGPSVTHSGLPQLVSVMPAMNELRMLNRNTSSSITPLGFIIVPTNAAPGFHISTQRVDSTGKVVAQPVAFQGNSAGTPAIQPELSQVLLAGASGVQPASSHGTSSGTSVTQPGFSYIISSGTSGSSHIISSATPVIQPRSSHITAGTPVTQSVSSHETSAGTSDTETDALDIKPIPLLANTGESVTEPVFSQVNIVESLVTQPGDSGAPVTQFEMPQRHFVITNSDEPESLIVKCEAESDDES